MTIGLHAAGWSTLFTHFWGSRRFATRDGSRNNWFVALMSFGEGWHNNHRAFPTSARHGLAWYEIDMSWWEIRLLQAIGLAKSVHCASIPRSGQLSEHAQPLGKIKGAVDKPGAILPTKSHWIAAG